jgi:hypothetical protein
MPIRIFALLTILLLLAQPFSLLAMETDQYNLPPQPLADIGSEVSQFVRDNILEAVARINAEIDEHAACLNGTADKGAHCHSTSTEQKKLAELRSGDAVARAIYKRLGDGTIFTTHAGDWLTSHDFLVGPARYKADYTDSIYVTMPINYATLSPTVRIDGVELGTDKVDHLFQQGYKYYKIYTSQLSKGKTPEQAAKKAVSWGKMTEKTYFGLWVAGVYSNADLFANYAGMKFYLGLTQPVKIGDETLPAVLSLVDGNWQVDGDITTSEQLLKPFVADQMNEALNPSGYSFIVYPTVRNVVRKRACREWKTTFPSLTKTELAERSRSLELWHGEDYGFTRKSRMVRLADTCFDN